MTFVTPGPAASTYLYQKSNPMSGSWGTYIVLFLILAHFVVGFAFLVKKLSGPVSENQPTEEEETTEVR